MTESGELKSPGGRIVCWAESAGNSDSPTATMPVAGRTDRSPISFGSRMAYGSASFVDTWPVWVPMVMATPVLTIQYGIQPWIVSLLFMLFRFWDAMADPIMGWISDNTHSRWGRRRPYIFVGALLVGVTFPLMWFFPRDASQQMIILWVGGSGLLLYSSLTLWAMPYHSLFLELTPDYHERTRINSYRFYCGVFFGLVIGWCWWFAKLPCFIHPVTGEPDTLGGTRFLAVVLGLIMAVFGVLPALFVKERFGSSDLHQSRQRSRLRDDVQNTLSNRNFLILIAVTVLFISSSAFLNSFGQFMSTFYVLSGDEPRAATFNGYWQTLSTGGVLLGLFCACMAAPRLGKRKTMALAIGAQLFGNLLTYLALWPGKPSLMLINAFFIGFGMQATWMLVGSMMADVVDEDELTTGRRREGSFSSVYSWAVKMSFTLGFGLSGPLLELTGFDVALGANQPEVFSRMKLVMTFLPVTVLAVALIVLRSYGVTEKTASATRQALEAKRGTI